MATQPSKHPLIAIAGSVDARRVQESGLRDTDRALGACEAPGRELAARGGRKLRIDDVARSDVLS